MYDFFVVDIYILVQNDSLHIDVIKFSRINISQPCWITL